MGQLAEDRNPVAQHDRNDRQLELVDEAMGDEAAGESRATIGKHRLSVLRLDQIEAVKTAADGGGPLSFLAEHEPSFGGVEGTLGARLRIAED